MRSVATASSVADLVRSKMVEVGVESGRELGRRCGLSKDTATAILSGRRPSPSEATLRKLADGLGLSIQALRQASGRARGERTPFVVPGWWDGLPLEQRDVLYQMALALRRVNEVPSPVGGNIVGHPPTSRASFPWAARHDDPDGPRVNPVFSHPQ